MKKEFNWKLSFIKIYTGQALSLITSSVVQYAFIWYITYETNSAMWLSIATLCGMLPQGILGLFIGGYIDRKNRKAIMIKADGFIGFVSIILCIFAFITKLPIWAILIGLSLRSVGQAFHSPALQSSIPLIVPEDKMLKYSGYMQAFQSISFIVSPAIAALLYDKVDFGFIISLDALGAILAIFTLIITMIPKQAALKDSKISIKEEFKAGLKIIRMRKIILYTFIASGIFLILFMPISSLFPLMTASYFNKDTFFAGIVEAVFATGMLIGGFSLGLRLFIKSRKGNIIASGFGIGAMVLLSGLVSNSLFVIFVIASFFIGLFGSIANGTITAIFNENVEPENLGKIYSIYMSLTVIALPLGMIISGVIGEMIGVNILFMILGASLLLFATFLLIMEFRNKRVVKAK